MAVNDEEPDLNTVTGRLQHARQLAGYSSPRAAAKHFDWNENTYKSHEFGVRQSAGLKEEHARKYARAFGVSLAWLMTGRGEPKSRFDSDLVRIIGRVGADSSGEVILSTGQESGDMAPPPPAATGAAVALEVTGHSMHGYADNGSLIYFEAQRTPPTEDMLNQVVIVEVEDGRVLVKRLLRGSERGLFDLQSINGLTLHDMRLVWAAHVTAIIPPHQARRIIVRSGTRPT